MVYIYRPFEPVLRFLRSRTPFLWPGGAVLPPPATFRFRDAAAVAGAVGRRALRLSTSALSSPFRDALRTR